MLPDEDVLDGRHRAEQADVLERPRHPERAVIWSGRRVVTSLPSKMTFPSDGRYSSVSMLKNVVFPAPLGPMIETIAFSGTRNDTLSTAVSPPKIFVR